MCRAYIRLVPHPEKDQDQNGKRHANPKFDNWYLIKGAIRQASFEAQMLHQFNYKLYYNNQALKMPYKFVYKPIDVSLSISCELSKLK